jgi:hypothetical protein
MAVKTTQFAFDRNPIPSRSVVQTSTQVQRRHIRSKLPSNSGVTPRKHRIHSTQNIRFSL